MSNLPPVYHTGSVKNIRGEEQSDTFVFEYSDRYSVFDWGEMPDLLFKKGEALASIAHNLYTFLEQPKHWGNWKFKTHNKQLQDLEKSQALKDIKKSGVLHNGLGIVDENVNKLETGTSRYYKVKRVNILRPEFIDKKFDYSKYQEKPIGCLVPLEAIFRFGLPKGSSLLKRLSKNPEYAKQIGINETPEGGFKEGAVFDFPVVEFSTKLESEDRYLTNAQAMEVAGLNQNEFNELSNLVRLVSMRLKDLFQDMELELWDGKFEFSFMQGENGCRRFQFVDSIGPDEVRLMHGKGQISKEFLRSFYYDTDWYEEVNSAKQKARDAGEAKWKKFCKKSPSLLEQNYKEVGENIYLGIASKLAQQIGEEDFFKSHMKYDFNDLLRQISNLS